MFTLLFFGGGVFVGAKYRKQIGQGIEKAQAAGKAVLEVFKS